MDFQIDKIYNEDCLEGMKRIADGAVDCIITDLPYGTTACAWDSVIPFEPMWEQFKRVTKPNAAIVLFCQGMFTAKLMMSQPKMWRYNLIWDKVRVTGFLNCKRMPMRQHEDIAVFYRELPTYNPQMEACLPHQRNHSRGPRKDDNTNRCYGQFKDAEPFMSDEKYPKSIVCYPNVVQDNDHPTQKPVDLLRYLILTYSNEGDTILDATIGSGTTAVAALMEKRHFIGFETNKEYFDIAQGRIDEVRRNPTLF